MGKEEHAEQSIILNGESSLNLFKSLPMGLALAEILFDDNSKPFDFRLVWMNDGFQAPTGITPEKANSKTGQELMPTFISRLIDIYSKPAIPGETSGFENYNSESGKWLAVRAYSPAKGYLMIILDDITLRKKAESAQKRYLKDLQALSRAAATLLELPPGQYFHRFIAEQMEQIIENCAVIVSSFNEGSGEFSLQAVAGAEEYMSLITALLGRSPVGMTLPIDEEARAALMSGKLQKIPGGIYRATFGAIPQQVIQDIEKTFNLDETYAIGFTWNGKLFGSAIIVLYQGYEIRNHNLVETFVSLASVALQRRQSDEELNRTKESLENKVLERTAQLKRSEVFFRAVTENALDAILVIDIGGIIRYQNSTANPMLGYPDDEVIGVSSFNFIHPDDLPLVKDKFVKAVHSPDYRDHFEVRLRHRDGTWHFCEIVARSALQNPAIEGIILNLRDITMRKLAEESLKQSQQELQGLFQYMAEGVVLLDVDGKVLKINQAAARIIGLNPTQIEGTFYDSPLWAGQVTLSDGSVLTRDELELSRIINLNRLVVNEEARLQLPDGTIRWLRGSITPLIDSSGKVESIIITFTDITAEKMFQEQLTQRLLEAQEEERKRIARELHDDTAQALSMISLELDSFISKHLCEQEAIDRLLKLKDSTDRTMQDVRRYSHELHPALLDHLGLISALEQLVAETGERANLNIRLEVKGDVRKLAEDVELALFRIAQESLNNTWKHAQATEAKVVLTYQPRTVKLDIIDNGRGFKVAQETVAALKRGSLGLISMRERASIIGANLEIESKANQGTRITVVLKTENNTP